VFAHSRYESGVAFALIMFLLALLGYLQFEHFTKHTHIFILTPWFILPLLLQRQLLGAQFENKTGDPFGLEFVIPNFKFLLNTLVDYHRLLPYSTVLNDIALACLPFVFLGVIKLAAPAARQFLAIALVVVLAILGVYMSYYFGNCKHPSSARFFVFLAIIAAMLPVAFCYFYPRIMNQYVLLTLAIVSAAIYHPIAAENRFTQTQTLMREVAEEYSYLEKLTNKNFLIITERPVNFTALGYGAVDFVYANKHHDEIMAEFHNHLYAILEFQAISLAANRPFPNYEFSNVYGAVVMKELQISGSDDQDHQPNGYFLRISWLGGIQP